MSEKKELALSPEGSAPLDTWALLAASGSEEDFSRLVEHFTPVLLSMTASLPVSETDRDDFFQEGLISLYKAVRLFDPNLSSFATFARICMRSALADGLRKYHPGDACDLSEYTESIPASLSEMPERILIGKETLQETLRRVDSLLSPMERRIFALSLQGQKTAEIAEKTGKDKKSVENTLYRLRKKLSGAV